MTEKKYGYVGWKEFLESRKELLSKFDHAKGRNQSRPVQIQHGVDGEGAFRKWLSDLLPAQFGVTSGYVIPSLLARTGYKLLHYDVIIYDRLAAPVLWIDGGDDVSEQGKRRAIPADHVRAIYEIKASFNKRSATEAMAKLENLADLKSHLVHPFHSGIVFFELPLSMVSKTKLLRCLIPSTSSICYTGGIILRCALNPEMSGVFRPLESQRDDADAVECLVPLAKDIDALAIHKDPRGRPVIAEQGAGLVCFSDGSDWHYRKLFGPTVRNKVGSIHLSWSYGGFTTFAVDLLTYLRGQYPQEDGYLFAQAFDRLDPPSV